MPQIPIMSGIYVDPATAAVRVRYPVNMVPVPPQGTTADGYLRPAEGIVSFATGIGADRGGIVWKGVHYRVSGTSLITVSSAGAVATIGAAGDIGGTGLVKMDFSFDLLGILANGLLYFYDGVTITHVTDPNIPANLIDMILIQSYWMVTDGTYIAVSNIGSPTTFNPTKYGSTDKPNPVLALLNVQDEAHVLSRNFVDVFQNVGGAGFPFQRVQTAVISKGAVGTRACCVFQDTAAFVGGGINEAPSVYLGNNAQSQPISTLEIDTLLLTYTTAELATIHLETVVDRGSKFVFVHLPDRTVVYDAVGSTPQAPMWHVRTSSIVDFAQYQGINITRANDVWIVGHPTTSAIGVWSTTDSRHYAVDVRWEFGTLMLRAGGKRSVVNMLELLAIPGTVRLGIDPRMSTSFSDDGVTWSMDRSIQVGKTGDRMKRLAWLQQGEIRNYRIQRFRGDSNAHLSVLALDADIQRCEY